MTSSPPDCSGGWVLFFNFDFECYCLDRRWHIVRISRCLDFDFYLVCALLKAFLHSGLAGGLIDLEIFLERLAALLGRDQSIGLFVIQLLRELDHPGDGQRLCLFLQFLVLDRGGLRLHLQRVGGFVDLPVDRFDCSRTVRPYIAIIQCCCCLV